MNGKRSVLHVDRLDLSFKPRPWPFALERRGEIDAWFAERRRAQPQLFNGRVLMLCEYRIADGVMRGTFLETDYASFLAWLDWGLPATGVWDCFGAAAVVTDDGAVLLGEMGAHTANAGKIYFPSGTPDPSDVAGGRVDLEASLARELQEETGLDAAAFAAEPGWRIVELPSRLVAVKVMRAPFDARALEARVSNYLAKQAEPELRALHLVRGSADITAAMPDFVQAFLNDLWR